MPIKIRDVATDELEAVLALNNAAGPNILPVDSARIQWFYAHASYFRVALIDGQIAGFLIALNQDSGHDSPNFLWFREHYAKFTYIDRIVVARAFRGAGLGRVFYADLQSFAEVRSPRIACEVFLEPGNDIALLFHGTFGFTEVGQQVMPGVERRVSLLIKELCSWPWVEAHYLQAGGGLPVVPWLRDRSLAATSSIAANG